VSAKTSLQQINLKASISPEQAKKRSGRRGVFTKYSLEDRHKACLAYLIKGTFLGAEQETGIYRQTMQKWALTDWWKEQTAKYREELEEEYRAQGHKIIKKAQEVILDRLENGDVYIDKKGNQKRRPVSMRETTFTYGVTYDKQRISLEKPTQVVVTTPQQVVPEQLEDKNKWLMDLASGFIQATKHLEARSIEGKAVRIEAAERPEASQPESPQESGGQGSEASGGDRPLDSQGRSGVSTSNAPEVQPC